MGTCGVHLIKFRMQAEAVIAAEPLKIMGGLNGRGIAARIVVPHVNAGLIDVGCPHKGGGVALQYQHPLARRTAFLRRIQAIQSRAEDDFVVGHRACSFSLYGLYFPARALRRIFIRSLLPLKPVILVGVLPVAG